MSDLISRKDAIAEFNCCEYTPDGGIDANYVIGFLEQMPSAESEIIRCKDCKRYGKDNCFMRIQMLWELEPNDFCSYAERKGESE